MSPTEEPDEPPLRETPPRRKWTEEEIAESEAEAAYYDSLQEEEEREQREAAIDAMVEWFEENFEDPQNETPYDDETGGYQYIWGGPFDAADMIGSQFGDQYGQSLIDAAVERVTSNGTFDWAPTPTGEFYEAPEEDDPNDGDADVPEARIGRAEISAQILSKLDALEATLARLEPAAPNIGHNLPPDEVGLPPYDEQSRRDLEQAARATREEVANDVPDAERLANAQTTFRKIGSAILKWIGRKLDLAVDEAIKATVKATAWATVATFALGLADDIATLVRAIFGH